MQKNPVDAAIGMLNDAMRRAGWERGGRRWQTKADNERIEVLKLYAEERGTNWPAGGQFLTLTMVACFKPGRVVPSLDALNIEAVEFALGFALPAVNVDVHRALSSKTRVARISVMLSARQLELHPRRAFELVQPMWVALGKACARSERELTERIDLADEIGRLGRDVERLAAR